MVTSVIGSSIVNDYGKTECLINCRHGIICVPIDYTVHRSTEIWLGSSNLLSCMKIPQRAEEFVAALTRFSHVKRDDFSKRRMKKYKS